MCLEIETCHLSECLEFETRSLDWRTADSLQKRRFASWGLPGSAGLQRGDHRPGGNRTAALLAGGELGGERDGVKLTPA